MKNKAWGLCHTLPTVVLCFLLSACAGGLSAPGGGGGGSAGASFSQSGLAFARETLNAASASQSVILTSTGSAALTISSIAVTGTNSGDFAQTNTCGTSLGAGSKCTINVTFMPTALGSRIANISITDNATGSPQTFSLTGTGVSSTTVANVTPAFLDFGNLTVNTTSGPQMMTVTNGGTTTFTVNTVTTAAPFAVSGLNPALPATLNANQSLTFQVTFAPTAVVASNGSVTVTYSGGLSSGTVNLSGTGVSAVTGPASAPAIFFTDLVSGPNSGGENGNGTILTLYGARFGATQGASTVTVGGGLVASYKQWSDTKISVALGAAAQTGNVVVTTANGPSNGTAFTVRAGNIFCVSTSGNDANTGAFPSNCWGTIVHGKNMLAAGDIVYIEDGVSATSVDTYNAALSIQSSGTASAPKALVAYPGTTVTVGTATMAYGLRIPNITVTADYWTIAGMKFLGLGALNLGGATGSNGWRIVGNDISCPNGNSASACVEGANTNTVIFYGNHVHDASANIASPTKLFHAVYWTTNSNHIDVGWNEIGPNNSCRGVQFHSTGGNNQFDLHVHDNYIHDIRCDAINFTTVDPSLGTVEAYNNLLVHVGAGPDPLEGPANYSGVFVANATNAGSACSTGCTVKVYNNTIYDAGAQQTSGNGDIVVKPGPNTVLAQNNIFQQLSNEVYISGGGTFTCDTNVLFGAGATAASCTNTITLDPLFVNVAGRDLHLLIGSPAVDKALTPPCPARDKDGVSRPQGAGCDIGAYESH
jgi:IPT/TIG domain